LSFKPTFSLSSFTFIKLGFNSMWNENFWMYKQDLEKAKEPDIKLPTPNGL